MKKIITIVVVAFTIASGAYFVGQSVNSKSVTANACDNGYCQ